MRFQNSFLYDTQHVILNDFNNLLTNDILRRLEIPKCISIMISSDRLDSIANIDFGDYTKLIIFKPIIEMNPSLIDELTMIVLQPGNSKIFNNNSGERIKLPLNLVALKFIDNSGQIKSKDFD